MTNANNNRIDNIDPAAFQDWLRDEHIYVYTEEDLDCYYRDTLDDEDVCIGSLRYSKSHILEEIDPTAYRCGFIDFIDGYHEIQDAGLFGGDYLEEGEDEEEILARYLDELEAED